MSPFRTPRRLASAALLAALLGATARPAAAQACTVGTLASYIGSTCELGGYRLFNFGFTTNSAEGSGAALDGTYTTPSAASITLTPFTDATGFGFTISGFTTGVGLNSTRSNGTRTWPEASIEQYVSFWGSSLGSARILGASVTSSVSATNTSTTTSQLGISTASTGRVFWNNYCLETNGYGGAPNGTNKLTAAGSSTNVTRTGACAPPESDIYVELNNSLDLYRRSGTTSRITGTAQASITQFRFTTPSVVVPEPATVVLLGGGLLGLAGIARRRRG